MLETLTAIKRAGADIIITYYARDAARICNASKQMQTCAASADVCIAVCISTIRET
jgi:hypothetical protein